MHPLINVITKIVRDASKIILRHLDRLDTIQIESKGANDFVTEIDQATELFIKEALLKQYPHYAFYGEESGLTGESDYCWICDPIDGTSNFIKGIPHFCISLALKHKNKIEHGIIFDPIRQEIFTASLGEGAFLNNHRIRTHLNPKINGAMVALAGKPAVFDQHLGINNLLRCQKLINFRKLGSAALDCAYVAAGRLDAAIGIELSLWDFAAGILLVQEAGGISTSLYQNDNLLKTGNLIVSNSELVDKLLKIWNQNEQN